MNELLPVRYERLFRDINAYLQYPIWLLIRREGTPDNHVYKRHRIASIASKYQCDTLIETGTFYGQMVCFAKKIFSKVKSVEIYPPLYLLNKKQFEREPNIDIYLGGSQDKLPEMINTSEGRILFWLDGHYSGDGTGGRDEVCPIIAELRLIAQSKRKDHCILIDDARLFVGEDGYPTMDETFAELRAINDKYQIVFDRDCIMALPTQDR